MRKMDIEDTYIQLSLFHRYYFPEWRVGQFIVNFEQWLKSTRNIDDIFYLENDDLFDYICWFTDEMSGGK